MPNVFIKKYPLDRTGKAVTNLIEDEPHSVGVQFNRIIAPNAGPYYEDSMIVFDTSGNRLVKGVDWDPLMPYVEASLELDTPVSNMIVIKNRDITEVILKEYQVPGGVWQTYTDAIIKLINSLMIDNREVQWDNIGGKPIRFQPTPHLHHLSDIYGFEYNVLGLEEILRAIQNGDVASHDVIYDYIENLRDWTKNQLDKLQDQTDDLYKEVERLDIRIDNVLADLDKVRKDLAAHIADKNNPHGTTKGQVGLGLVENYPPATDAEAITATARNRYIVPANLKAFNDSVIQPVIKKHIDDKNNPHGVTKAQVGLGSVQNYPIASQVEAEQGIQNERYMTPLRVAQYASKEIIPKLNAHVADKNNPHGVTKNQVGLGSVANYPMAVEAEARAATSNERYLSPLRGGQLFDTRFAANLAKGGNANVNKNKAVTIDDKFITRVGQEMSFQNGNGEVANIKWDGTSLYYKGKINAEDVYIRSDERIKNNIRYFEEMGEDVTPRLRNLAKATARYELNTEFGVEQIGLIAQRVMKEMPELTTINPGTGIISLKPAGFIALLLKGWDELDRRVGEVERTLGIYGN